MNQWIYLILLTTLLFFLTLEIPCLTEDYQIWNMASFSCSEAPMNVKQYVDRLANSVVIPLIYTFERTTFDFFLHSIPLYALAPIPPLSYTATFFSSPPFLCWYLVLLMPIYTWVQFIKVSFVTHLLFTSFTL